MSRGLKVGKFDPSSEQKGGNYSTVFVMKLERYKLARPNRALGPELDFI